MVRLIPHDAGVDFPVGAGGCDLHQLHQRARIFLAQFIPDSDTVYRLPSPVQRPSCGVDMPIGRAQKVLRPYPGKQLLLDAGVDQERAQHRLLRIQRVLPPCRMIPAHSHPYTSLLGGRESGKEAGGTSTSFHRALLRYVLAYGFPTPFNQSWDWI